MNDAAARLRELLREGDLIVVAECLSAITARVVEDVGFNATYCGGNALGTFHHAIPDYGVFTSTEMAAQVAAITASVEIPVIVDADQGGETVANVYRAIQCFERAGASGAHIEDSTNPKHSRVVNDLISVTEMQQRIRAAVSARSNPDFVVIARSEGLFNKRIYGDGPTIEEVIERGNAYAEAGADVFMPICMDPADIPQVAAAVPIPLFDINHAVSDIEATPLRGLISSGWAGPSAVRTHRQWATELYTTGSISKEAFQFQDREHLISAATYDALLAEWATQTSRTSLAPGQRLSAYS